MQAAVEVGAGAMAAFIGIEADLAQAIAAEATGEGLGVCDVANDNGGGQIVLSGIAAAVERAMALAKAKGVKRAIPLAVSAPFHCALMQPAADAMAAALSKVQIASPLVPLVANVLALPVTEPNEIRALLVRQVTGTVRWRESIAYMADQGVTVFFECGAGKVLSGLVKRIAGGAVGYPVGTPGDLDVFKVRMAS
jgi:[acyl-carrier-protein] S-malonyltransferase